MANATLSTNGSTPTGAKVPPTALGSITIPKIEKATLYLDLVGDSPLICHAWSEKAKKQMLDKQMKKATTAKEAKDPEQDFRDSLYQLPPDLQDEVQSILGNRPACKYGFPAVGFKSAAVSAGSLADMQMTRLRKMFHVLGDLVPIEGAPVMREDMVRIAMGTADIRYRGQFTAWRTTIAIEYLPFAITPEQLINLFDLAGFGVGVGEWRPERDGQFGRFHVANQNDR